MYRSRRALPVLLAGLGILCAVPRAQAAEDRSTLADQTDVAVTIYNDNLALVKDQRSIRLRKGPVTLAFRDVSARMRPETAQFRNVRSPGSFSVLEQNFDFDLLTPAKMLEKFVGQSVRVLRVNPATGQESSEPAEVLSANSGVVLRFADRIETGIPGRIVYPDVPGNLRDRPTLVMSLTNNEDQPQSVELSYLTAGLAWKADYVVELGAQEDRLDIGGWVTLTNTSGASYRNAKLQLVAGDVNQAPQEIRRRLDAPMPAAVSAMKAAPMSEESLFEYHLYTLDHPTTLSDNQTKQVALLSASAVAARKEFVLRGADYYYQSAYGDLGQKLKVGVFLEFDNREQSHLGMPLPKGVVRVYKRDSAGNAQFIGEDRIDHTAKNETVRLKLGDAFDVTAAKKQTDFKVSPGIGKFSRTYESAFDIEFKNAKKEAVVVVVQEPMPGEWSVTSESQSHVKGASNTAVWSVKVPPEGSTRLSYRVLVRL